jgi:CHASE3 domain sensor protein
MAFFGQVDPVQQQIQQQVQAATDWIKNVFWILIIVAILVIIFMSLKGF